MKYIIILITSILMLGCLKDNQGAKDAKSVEQQQSQYAKGQPVPVFDWSLERHLVTELYRVRNQRVATHAVWRSDYGLIEGDCPAMGYGLPYDTSLTNPLKTTDLDQNGYRNSQLAVIEQAEPNGIFASKNTAATWVMCVGKSGSIEPVYIEAKVTIYPGPVKVNYTTNRVIRFGAATVKVSEK